ncbi:MAG: beta-propeller domain-containing protein, partial [Sulfolobales archaeon]|nr:beta-propeller domain-containing protein [Sulfolobales archaeon]MDW8010915.1 beta-propeller domain-containing protein [Sulfolobales archaeon]
MSRGRTYALVAIAILAGILASTLPHYLTRTYGPPLERREEVTSEERGVGAVVSGTYRATEIRGVKTFSSYAELLNYVDGVLLLKRTASRVGVPGEAVLPVTLGTADKAARDTRASKTNVQVEGVDELDIAKTDGDIIAVAVGDSIYVVDARSKKVVSSFRANSTITGLFLLEKKIVALSLSTELYSPYSPILRHAQALVQESSTTIWVIDVSNAEKPEVEFKAFVTGSPLTARAIGNYIYVLVTQPIETLEVPALNGKPLPPGSIGLVDEEPDSYTTIAVLDLSDYSYTAYSFLTGPGSWVYMSLSRLYVGSSRYLSTYTAYKLFLDALVRYLPREVADSVGKLLSSGRVGEALEAAYSYLNGVS